MLTDAEKLGIAVNCLDKHGLDRYVQVCEKREQGCPDGWYESCEQIECRYT